MRKMLIILLLFISCSFSLPPQIADGVIVDNTDALVLALGSADKIYLREGTYTPQDMTINRDEVTLTAYPGETPVIAGTGYRVLLIAGSNVTVSGITFDGMGALHEVIKVTYEAGYPLPDNVTLDNITILRGNSHGILVTHAGRIVIKDSVIRDTGQSTSLTYEPHGIYISDTKQAVITGNEVFPFRGMGIHIYSGLDGQRTYIDGNEVTDIGCYYGSCVITNNIVRALGLRYNVVSARVYHNTFLDPSPALSNIFIHNLRRDAVFDIVDNIIPAKIYARNPYGKAPVMVVHHNNLPLIDADFPFTAYDNAAGLEYGVWILPLDYYGNLRGDPPKVGAVE